MMFKGSGSIARALIVLLEINSYASFLIADHIQLFQERLSEKVHATMPTGVVGDFEFTVFQRNFREWHKRPWKNVCVC